MQDNIVLGFHTPYPPRNCFACIYCSDSHLKPVRCKHEDVEASKSILTHVLHQDIPKWCPLKAMYRKKAKDV